MNTTENQAARIAELKKELAAEREERRKAVAYSNSIERGEVKFESLLRKEMDKILTLGLEKGINEGIGDVVIRRIRTLEDTVRNLLVSATPHPMENPTMHAAWKEAGKVVTKFPNVSCSQCGGEFGPGNHGFSHCEDHSKDINTNE